MLKVVFMLNCDSCGHPFDRITASARNDPMIWKALALDLEARAERCGWTLFRSAHHCDYCVTDQVLSARPKTSQDTPQSAT